MLISAYTHHARDTAVYPVEYKIVYPMFGLVGETGEFCNKWKKVWRDKAEFPLIDQRAELGDILWYWTNLCLDLNHNPSQIALENIKKLQKRKLENTLHGSGDNR